MLKSSQEDANRRKPTTVRIGLTLPYRTRTVGHALKHMCLSSSSSWQPLTAFGDSTSSATGSDYFIQEEAVRHQHLPSPDAVIAADDTYCC